MILLVTASDRGSDCIRAIEAGTGETAILADSLVRATTMLREGTYLAVVIDQQIAGGLGLEVDALLWHLDTAIRVEVNFGIHSKDRLVHEVRSAIERRQQDEASALKAATSKLYGNLNSTMTALALTVELARDAAGLPPAASEKLKSVHNLVRELRSQLEGGSAEENLETAGALGS